MWNFLFYIIHIMRKEGADCKGIEFYVRDLVARGGVGMLNWIPLREDQSVLDTRKMLGDLSSSLTYLNQFEQRLAELDAKLVFGLNQVSKALKLDEDQQLEVFDDSDFKDQHK